MDMKPNIVLKKRSLPCKSVLSQSHLRYVKSHLEGSDVIWQKVLWFNEIKIDSTNNNKNHTIVTVKNGGGSIILFSQDCAIGQG